MVKRFELLKHQLEAIERALQCLSKWKAKDDRGAALAQMPTASSKTGIIAVLTRACPEVKRSLVLAPRLTICDNLTPYPRTASLHTVLQLQTTMATVGSMGARLRVFCSP